MAASVGLRQRDSGDCTGTGGNSTSCRRRRWPVASCASSGGWRSTRDLSGCDLHGRRAGPERWGVIGSGTIALSRLSVSCRRRPTRFYSDSDWSRKLPSGCLVSGRIPCRASCRSRKANVGLSGRTSGGYDSSKHPSVSRRDAHGIVRSQSEPRHSRFAYRIRSSRLGVFPRFCVRFPGPRERLRIRRRLRPALGCDPEYR
jgi:hypothetical protein